MMSGRLMNRAVEISVGSLSPTINWTTLKLGEFDLSPLNQQRRIAEVLWAVDKAQTKWQQAANQYTKSLHVFTSAATLRGLGTQATQQTPIGATREESL